MPLYSNVGSTDDNEAVYFSGVSSILVNTDDVNLRIVEPYKSGPGKIYYGKPFGFEYDSGETSHAPRFEHYEVFYASTLIETFSLVSLDQGREYMPIPCITKNSVTSGEYNRARIIHENFGDSFQSFEELLDSYGIIYKSK